MPKVVHRLPDFDQDSWSINSLPKTVKDSSVTALPSDSVNNNNNNSTFSTPCLAKSSAEQVLDPVFASNHTDELQAPSRTSSRLAASAADASINTAAAAAAASPQSQPSATSGGSHTANPEAPETVTPSGLAADSQTTSEAHEEPMID